MESGKKVALVTGASRGIGKAIAIELARRGADLIINYTSRPDAAEEVAAQIRKSGGRALLCKADVAEEMQVKAMIEQALGHFGRIDILVNNAALHRGGRVQKIDPTDFGKVIDIVLRGAFHCCRHIVPMMAEAHWGRIINISSNAGLHGHAGDTAYGAAKAGLIGFTKSLAKETASRNITANVVVPGFIQTEMTAPLFDNPVKVANELAGIPMGRPGDPAEVAEVVGFLAFKGSYVTGTVVNVDGGMGM